MPRQLPLSVDTKFIERNSKILSQWLDLVSPSESIKADERAFVHRYGLNAVDPPILIRLLDDSLQSELAVPWTEFSLPSSKLSGSRSSIAKSSSSKTNSTSSPLNNHHAALSLAGQAWAFHCFAKLAGCNPTPSLIGATSTSKVLRFVTIARFLPSCKELPDRYSGRGSLSASHQIINSQTSRNCPTSEVSIFDLT